MTVRRACEVEWRLSFWGNGKFCAKGIFVQEGSFDTGMEKGKTLEDARLLESLWDVAGPRGSSLPETVPEWVSLCAWMNQHGVLVSCFGLLRGLAPKPVVRQVETALSVNRGILRYRAELLGLFASAAAKEHLPFAVIKGMASSYQIYGDWGRRQNGDVDVLVHPDDIPKADYVLRRLGWFQPAEAFRVRNASSKCFGTDELSALQSPYPFRSSPFLPHVTNYYFPGKRSLVSVELHDRFHCVGPHLTPLLLSDVDRFKVDGIVLPTLVPVAQAALSLFSLHEDSEGVRSAVGRSRDLGVKACVDLVAWLQLLDKAEKSALLGFVESCDALFAAGSALANCMDLFSWAKGDADPLPIGQSRWDMGYRDRLSAPGLAVQSAVKSVLDASVSPEALARGLVVAIDDRWHRALAPGCSSFSGFRFRSHLTDRGVFACWTVPSFYARYDDDLVFHVVIAGRFSQCVKALRVEIRQKNSDWEVVAETVDAENADSHAGSVRGVGCGRAFAMPDGNGGMKLEVEIDLPSMAKKLFSPAILIPCAYYRVAGSIFRPIAGRTLVQVADEAVRMQQDGSAGTQRL